MADLIERLRDCYENWGLGSKGPAILAEAATELEALRRRVEELEGRCEKEHANFLAIGERFVQAKIEAAQARRLAIEECARYHDDQAAHHAAAHEHVVSDHHEMMERQHKRDAAAIRALRDAKGETVE